MTRPAPHIPAKPSRATFVALLRGINVGGKHMLPMSALARVFKRAGAESVRTYIQSGNVLFAATPGRSSAIAADVGAHIQKQFGFATPIVLRSADDLRRITAPGPPLKSPSGGNIQPDDHTLLHVGFLASTPAQRLVKLLDPSRSPHDRFVVKGGELYVHFARGVAGTKLTSAYFDSTLQTICTFRNWRTVLKLHELLQSM